MVRLIVTLLCMLAAFFVLAIVVPAVALAQATCPTPDELGCAAIVEAIDRNEQATRDLDTTTAELRDLLAALAADGTHLRVRIDGQSIVIPVGLGELRSQSELPVADGTLRETHEPEEGGGGPVARVRLTSADRGRLDLSAYGVWAIVGLILVSLIAGLWYRAFRWE